MKLPGTPAVYAAIMAIFGQTPAGIHLGFLLVNAATTVLVYFLAVRLSGKLAAVVAAAFYASLSTNGFVLGLAFHAEALVVLAALGGILLLLKAVEGERSWLFFASGALFGLGFLMKQSGLAFAAFGLLYLIKSEWKRPLDRPILATWGTAAHLVNSRVGGFALGVALPFALTCLMLAASGVFETFWFWTVAYASQYASELGFSEGLRMFVAMFPPIAGAASGFLFSRPPMEHHDPGQWIIAAVGIAFLWQRENRPRAFFVGSLLFFSFLAVCPGFYFRAPYFVQLLPAAALLAGIAINSATQRLILARCGLPLITIPVLFYLIAFAWSVASQRTFLFELNPQIACRFAYGGEPFPEAAEVGNYIRNHASKDARIAVLGSEPEILFYAKRLSATGTIYMYGLFEQQPYALQMQKQMIDEIESAHAEFLVRVRSPGSWGMQPGSPGVQAFFSWVNPYVNGGVVSTSWSALRISGSTKPSIAGGLMKRKPTKKPIGISHIPRKPHPENTVEVFKRKAIS